MKKVYLVGFMGCGKTTAGKLLAKLTGFTHVDTDAEIENETGKTVSEIFSQQGETAFREMEFKLMNRYFSSSDNLIISAGGGLPCFHDLMSCMTENGITVYLNCDEDVLEQRLKENVSHRPLIHSGELRKSISEKMVQRKPIYEKAQIIVNGNQSPEKVAEEILKKLY